MKAIPKIALIALLSFLAGCASYYYSYLGVKHKTPERALAAQAEYLESIERDITRLPTPSANSALVLTPSRSTVEALGVTRTGSPKQELVDYIATTSMRDYSAFGGYLRASGAFFQVSSRVVDFPQMEAKRERENFDAVIYLHAKSPSQVGWFVVTPNDKTPSPIIFDALSADGAPRIDSWVRSIASQME